MDVRAGSLTGELRPAIRPSKWNLSANAYINGHQGQKIWFAQVIAIFTLWCRVTNNDIPNVYNKAIVIIITIMRKRMLIIMNVYIYIFPQFRGKIR